MSTPHTGDQQTPAGIAKASFARRVTTAVLFGAAVLVSIAAGTIPTGLVIGAMAGLASWELYPIIRPEGRVSVDLVGVAATFAMPAAAGLWGGTGLWVALSVLVVLILAATAFDVHMSPRDGALALSGAVLVGFTLAHFVLDPGLGGSPGFGSSLTSGLMLALVVLASVWLNDSLAYIVGSQFGRHRMAPTISPKKSWEGFAGGALGGLIPWGVAPFLPTVELSLAWSLLTGAAVAVAVVVGDLAESRMKRTAGVKDSGTILPGHGGFLDRLDSLILVSLVAYWMLVWGGVR